LRVLRYLGDNPVKAGLVSSDRDWLRSSYGEAIGEGSGRKGVGRVSSECQSAISLLHVKGANTGR